MDDNQEDELQSEPSQYISKQLAIPVAIHSEAVETNIAEVCAPGLPNT